MKLGYLVVVSLLWQGCITPVPTETKSTSIAFQYFEKTFIAVPIRVNDVVTETFILDTGIGLTIISKSLCEKISCKMSGASFTGKRMSGQDVTVPLAVVAKMSLGNVTGVANTVGVLDLEQMMPGAKIAGFISLDFFKNAPFTIDYKKEMITLESPESLREVQSRGNRVPVRLDRQGPSLGVFMPLVLPGGMQISAEVDTGSQSLILDERFLEPLGFSRGDVRIKKRVGRDETGHEYERYSSTLRERVHLSGLPTIGMDSMGVMFQKIIYDGLVGHDFLSQFTVTYDLANSEMVFNNKVL